MWVILGKATGQYLIQSLPKKKKKLAKCYTHPTLLTLNSKNGKFWPMFNQDKFIR